MTPDMLVLDDAAHQAAAAAFLDTLDAEEDAPPTAFATLVRKLHSAAGTVWARPHHATRQDAGMYVTRALENADAWAAWATATLGVVPDANPHVTIVYSRQAVALPHAARRVTVPADAVLGWERLGDAVALRVASPALEARWREARQAGATWAYPEYKPHVTLTYDPERRLPVETWPVPPLALVFGPEVAGTLDGDVFDPDGPEAEGIGAVAKAGGARWLGDVQAAMRRYETFGPGIVALSIETQDEVSRYGATLWNLHGKWHADGDTLAAAIHGAIDKGLADRWFGFGEDVRKAAKDPKTGKPPGYYARQAVRQQRAQQKLAAAWDAVLPRVVGLTRAQLRKTWETRGDGKVREAHAAMHGRSVGYDEPFILPTGTLTWGAPAEPNCRCRTEIRVAGGALAKAEDARLVDLLDAETRAQLEAALAAAWAPDATDAAYEAAVAGISDDARALMAKGAAVGVPVPPLVAEVLVQSAAEGTPIAKADAEHGVFAGWASVLTEPDGTPLEDTQGDVIDEADLVPAAERYVQDWRRLGDTHTRVDGLGEAVESLVLTKAARDALGLAPLPTGWLLAFHATDPVVKARLADGTYAGLSIGGSAVRSPLPDPVAKAARAARSTWARLTGG